MPDLWSGIVKLKILLAPGANSSTVTVAKICNAMKPPTLIV